MTTAYLPPVSWWRRWMAEGMPRLDREVRFDRQLWMNRCAIDAPNGMLTLTVPIEKPESIHPLVKDVRISGHGDWQRKHWHALRSSYDNSPFFEYYADDFLKIYEDRSDFLVDFNEKLIVLITELFGINSSISSQKTCVSLAGQPYYQVFSSRHGFLSDLSIVDLLFNMGPEGLRWLV